MSLARIVCPECGAGLKSGSGFSVGETVNCPKCESAFTVEDPDDDDRPAKKPARAVASRAADEDADDTPRKKKRRRDDDDEDDGRGKNGSYKSSPLRYAILGVLVVVMLVLGVMLYQKKKKEREAAKAPNPDDTPAALPPPGPLTVRPMGNPNDPRPVVKPGFSKGNQFRPKTAGGVGFDTLGLGGGGVDLQKVRAELTQKLVANWEGTAPDGSVHKVQYRADGQYTHTVEGPGASMTGGNYQVTGLVGTKGLKLNRGGRPATVVFEDDELIHDTGTPGQSVVLRKK